MCGHRIVPRLGHLGHSQGFGDVEDEEGGDDDDVDMEITFMPGLSERKGEEEETSIEKYQRKMREKKKKRKEERKERKEKKNRTNLNYISSLYMLHQEGRMAHDTPSLGRHMTHPISTSIPSSESSCFTYKRK